MIGDCNINNLAKNQVSAVFHSRAIRRSVSPKFIELCMETSLHKHGGRDVTKTSVELSLSGRYYIRGQLLHLWHLHYSNATFYSRALTH